MIEDNRLKIFMEVIAQGGFTKAADSLGISQSSVSQHIAELERKAGCRLFSRHTSGFSLTPQGQVFRKYAERILEACAAAERTFSPLPPSNVRIGVSDDVWNLFLLPKLNDFMAVHPQVTFERTSAEDADLRVEVSLAAAVTNVKGLDETETGDLKASRSAFGDFSIILRPSADFSVTQIFESIRRLLV